MGRREWRFLGNFNSLNPNPSQPATHAARLSKSVTYFLSEISIAKRRKFRWITSRTSRTPSLRAAGQVRARPEAGRLKKADAVKAVSALAHTRSNCCLTIAASAVLLWPFGYFEP